MLPALIAPPLLIRFVGAPLARGEILPPLFKPTLANEQEAANILAAASSSLTTMSLALIVGPALLVRNGKSRPDAIEWVIGLAAIGAAVLSIFFGYRLQVGITTQLSVYHLDVEKLLPALELQGQALIASASLMFALAVDSFTQPAPARRNRDG